MRTALAVYAIALVLAGALLPEHSVAAGTNEVTAVSSPVSGVDTQSLWAPALRMILSLAAVLAALAGCALLARKLRSGGRIKGGLIQVVSGISLGSREKVVLLRVGGEDVLIGVSPAGMRPLHVLKRPPQEFSELMDVPQ
jgi:flagellar protein FliO/FliZ